MWSSPSQLEHSLEQGQVSLKELLELRRKLQAPFKLHPLGFFSCTLMSEGRQRVRLHYWPAYGGVQQSPECQIHDHLFEFKSWVLAGTLENIEYAYVDEGREFVSYQTTYNGDASVLTKTGVTLKLREQSRTIHSAGARYSMPAGVLHETLRVGTAPAFTVLITNDVSDVAPIVLGPRDGKSKFVYRRKVLPEIDVEEMLTDLALAL